MSAATTRQATGLQADAGQIAPFFDALFRYADEGTFLSLRAFDQFNKGARAALIKAVRINGDAGPVVAGIAREATHMANTMPATVFCPPIATFGNPHGASAADLANGVALSIEIDEASPPAGIARLQSILGPATIVVASGGEWTDPVTGEVHDKAHTHWRLTEPTRTPDDHARLREARRLATMLAGGDPSAMPPVHPLRWPGSWNRKREPGRMARITHLNEAAEVELGDALERLQEAVEAAGLDNRTSTGPRTPGAPQAPVADVAAALLHIPNDDVHWKQWLDLGYATYGATGGSDAGLEAWAAWSAKSAKHSDDECLEQWNRFHKSPPTKIGAGTIFFHAKAAGWQRSQPHPEPEPTPAADAAPSDPGMADGKTSKKNGADKSRSAQAFKVAAETRRAGGDYAAFLRALDADPETRAWRVEKGEPDGGRELRRTWDKAAAAVEQDVLLTEHGVALAFAKRFRHRLRYDHDQGTWFEWIGTHWRRDRKHAAFSYARAVVAEANRNTELKTQAITGKAAFAGGVEKFAQRDPDLATTSDDWDRDPWLLGTPGGTVDLRSGKLEPARCSDLITKQTAVAPADTEDCPRWHAFLDEVTAGNAGLIRFLQQWCGYCLTGTTREEALLFVHGSGGNGKGKFLGTVQGVLGDYCKNAAMDTFTASRGDRHSTDLAMLVGARMVCASETEAGHAWAEARIKQMTGGDVLTARFMRQDNFEYRPQFKLTIIGNHAPVLQNVDDAARRRFNIVPFNFKPEKRDLQLEEKLRREWPGILRWAINGCLDWHKHGLVRPSVVMGATEEYLNEQDSFGRWLEERTEALGDQESITVYVQKNGQSTPHETPGAASAAMFRDWTEWAKARGEAPKDQRAFAGSMRRRGHEQRKVASGMVWVGLKLLPSDGGAW